MRLIGYCKKHICSFSVAGATLLMLAVMLIPLGSASGWGWSRRQDAAALVLGARRAIAAQPVYDGRYVKGYPPETVGVCTDVVWRAFREAGYSLRDMVDADIAAHPEAYPDVTVRDSNIDYRRVVNLHVFFARHARELTLDLAQTEEWQPGDIVIFQDDRHIGILSDQRNAEGLPLVIHHSIRAPEEADYLREGRVTAHFRFDAGRIPKKLLIEWAE